MKHYRRLGLPLIVSALGHAYAAWHLYAAHEQPSSRTPREIFEVRLLPAAAAQPPAPSPPLAEPLRAPPPIERPRPEPRPKPMPQAQPAVPVEPALEPDMPPPAEPEAVLREAEPVPDGPVTVSAPAALVAAGPGAVAGGIVQRPSGVVGGVASSGSFDGVAPARPTRVSPAPITRVAKLSDLSRKPRPPSLNAALRQNYPRDLRRRGVEGQAEVRVLITSEGRVGNVSIVSESAAGFARACRDTLLASRWTEPVDRHGKPVNTRLTYRCRFEVGD